MTKAVGSYLDVMSMDVLKYCVNESLYRIFVHPDTSRRDELGLLYGLQNIDFPGYVHNRVLELERSGVDYLHTPTFDQNSFQDLVLNGVQSIGIEFVGTLDSLVGVEGFYNALVGIMRSRESEASNLDEFLVLFFEEGLGERLSPMEESYVLGEFKEVFLELIN